MQNPKSTLGFCLSYPKKIGFLTVFLGNAYICPKLGNAITQNFLQCRGSGGMLPRNFFENLHAAMVILALLEHLKKQFVICLVLNFESFTKCNAFCSQSFDYACFKAILAYCFKEVRNYGKVLSILNVVENS